MPPAVPDSAPPDWDRLFGPEGPIGSIPSYEPRSQQARMAKAVWEAIRDSHHLAVEAGTGTGKTLSYLLPAILSDRKIIISTGTKALQDQIFFKDIPLLAESLKRPIRSAVVKGRENYLCRRRMESFLTHPTLIPRTDRGFLKMIMRWIGQTGTGDRSELADLPENTSIWAEINARSDLCRGSKCRHFEEECFITRLRRRAARAAVVIANHHLLMSDLQLRDSGYGSVLPPAEVIILDEAHLLEEVATGYFGVRMTLFRIESFFRDLSRELREIGETGQKWRDITDHALAAGKTFFGTLAPVENRSYLKPLITGRVWETIQPFKSLLEGLGSRIELVGGKSDELRDLGRRLEAIINDLNFVVACEDPDYVYWVEGGRSGLILMASPVEVAPFLDTLLFQPYDSVTLTSATITVGESFEFFFQRIGCREARTLILPSPFDYESQALLYIPTHLPDPNDPSFPEAAAEEMGKLVRISSGRALLLFTAYRNLAVAAGILESSLPYPVLVQGKGDRTALLETFREKVHSVLLGTRSFWQGIDVPGESLSLLVIDKLPFASPADPLNDSRARRVAGRGLNPFMDYSLPQAVITLRQGLGRLIRRTTDRGILALLDNRILTRRYGTVLRRSLPACPVTHRIEEGKDFLQRY